MTDYAARSRFFSSQPITSDEVEIDGSEHQHLSKVMRLREGDVAILFDGLGKEFSATIVKTSRNATLFQIDDVHDVDRELTFQLTLAVALPKGDRQQWLVEKCVELGVTELTPLTTSRGVAQPEKALQRIERWVIAASKQCRRNRLMSVTSPQSITSFLARHADVDAIVLHPTDESQTLSDFMSTSGRRSIAVAIGPEGGFTDDEIATSRDTGARIVSLGARILRVETAALSVAATLVFGERD